MDLSEADGLEEIVDMSVQVLAEPRALRFSAFQFAEVNSIEVIQL